MTREEARKAAEVMLAYADGKTIEVLVDKTVSWPTSVLNPEFNWQDYTYRVKDGPKYRPFKDAEECWNEMQKHKPFGWVKKINTGEILNIRKLTNSEIITSYTADYIYAFKGLTFVDGEPFGIKEK